MALILHVGDGKCGSTALQDSLHSARDSLLNQGYLYETGPRRKNHFLITSLLGKGTRSLAENQINYAHEMLKTIALRQKEAQHTIISSENLFLTSPQDVIDLLESYNIKSPNTYVVAYVREPCGMYASLIQQEIKASSVFQSPELYKRPIDRFTSLWQKAVGKDRLSVRLFDRQQLVGGNIITDFSAWLSDFSDGLKEKLPIVESNNSMSAEQLIALQRMRRHLPAEFEGKFHPSSNSAIDAFSIMNKSGLIGNKISLKDSVREMIWLGNRDIVANINKLTSGTLVQSPGNKLSATSSVSDASLDRLSDVSEVLNSVDLQLTEILNNVITCGDAIDERRRLISRYEGDYSKQNSILHGLEALDRSLFKQVSPPREK